MSGAACWKMIDGTMTNFCLEKFVIQTTAFAMREHRHRSYPSISFIIYFRNILCLYKSLARLENYFIDMLFIT
jgi:hypothetical protein